MSFADYETSEQDSSPVELYRFAMGLKSWLYTSAEHAVRLPNGEQFRPVAIRRNEIVQTRTLQKSSLTLTLQRDLEACVPFIAGGADQVMTLTIYRMHRAEGAVSPLAIWKGRVLQCSFSGISATMDCEPVFTSLRRMGLRRTFGAACPHVLYGPGCRLWNENWRVSGSVSFIDGARVTIPGLSAKPSGWFLGGELEIVNLTRRLIVAHEGDVVTLSAAVPGLTVGASVHAYAGCDHSVADCRDKFGNLDNYGGFPFVPGKNPFGGNSIF